MRRMLVLALAAMLITAACAKKRSTTETTPKKVTGAQTFTISVDWPSPAGRNLQFSAFYPKMLKVRPGDTVVFENRSSQAIHTVTFGPKADRSDAPAPVLPTGQDNPAAFAPCFSDAAPTATMSACPAPAKAAAPATSTAATPPTPTFGGAGYWNSGVLPPNAGGAAAPPPAARQVRFTVGSLKTGPVTYMCLLHPFMVATLDVVATDAERVGPSDATSAGSTQYERDEAAALKLPQPTPAATGTAAAVVAGISNQVVTVNEFFPKAVDVKAGTTVTWNDESLYEPHTITFQSPFKSPDEPGVNQPKGVRSGGAYTGGVAHSGLIGPKPFPSDSFSLQFTKAGTYSYVCVLHPGMAGTVNVS